jgi:peptidyl-prolyl cis-trans isomerase SurA
LINIKRKLSAVLILMLLTTIAFSGCTETENNDVNDNGELSENVVATVNGEGITSDDVEATQQSYVQQGQQISEEEALEQLIDQEVLSQYSLQEEFMPSDTEVEGEINTNLEQYNMTQEELEQQLAQSGMTYEEYFQSVKEGLAMQNCLSKAVDEYNVSDEDAEQQINMILQQYNMTKGELEQQLAQSGMTYEDYLDQMKQQIAQGSLLEDIKEDAEIKYL